MNTYDATESARIAQIFRELEQLGDDLKQIDDFYRFTEETDNDGCLRLYIDDMTFEEREEASRPKGINVMAMMMAADEKLKPTKKKMNIAFLLSHVDIHSILEVLVNSKKTQVATLLAELRSLGIDVKYSKAKP